MGYIIDIDAEAKMLTLGLAVHGLENLLGNMGPEGWGIFEIREELEQGICTFFGIVWLVLKARQRTGDGV